MPSSASATTHTYTLSLHDALPISRPVPEHTVGDVLEPLGVIRQRRHTHLAAQPVGPRDLADDHERAVAPDVRRGHRPILTSIRAARSEEHTSELQSPYDLVCRLLLPPPPTPTLFPYTTLFRSRARSQSTQSVMFSNRSG